MYSPAFWSTMEASSCKMSAYVSSIFFDVPVWNLVSEAMETLCFWMKLPIHSFAFISYCSWKYRRRLSGCPESSELKRGSVRLFVDVWISLIICVAG